MKPPHRFFAVIFGAALLAALLPVFSQNSLAERSSETELKKGFEVFRQVFTLIQVSYVDAVEPSRLVNGALNGMLRALDPYSQFLDAKAFGELQSDTKGEFGGIGVEVSVKGGVLHVISPLDGAPADKAGLRPGDLIHKIDGVVTKDITLTDAVRRLRGKPGEPVVLTVLHEGEPEAVELSVVREVVKVRGIREAKLLDGATGYIRISEFQEQTPKDFKRSIEELQTQGMKGLIIDVRNNPGGLLDSAVQVAENFISEGKLIVETKGRLAKKSVRYISRNRSPENIQPLVVLVNKGSASGAEILAGAAQDHAFGRVVGTKTYGKGCVQTLTPLADGTAVRITTSRYYTPKGRLIHEIGIAPDVEVKGDRSDPKDVVLERALEIMRTPFGGEALVT